jgi:hypothetical protein
MGGMLSWRQPRKHDRSYLMPIPLRGEGMPTLHFTREKRTIANER